MSYERGHKQSNLQTLLENCACLFTILFPTPTPAFTQKQNCGRHHFLAAMAALKFELHNPILTQDLGSISLSLMVTVASFINWLSPSLTVTWFRS